MNKKFVSIIVFTSLFCLVSFVSAVSIPNPLSFNTFNDLLCHIASEIGTVIASLGAIMIIVAGFFYLTSAGSPERIGVAKKALIYAIAGIAIGLAATIIVNVVKDVIGATGGTTC